MNLSAFFFFVKVSREIGEHSKKKKEECRPMKETIRVLTHTDSGQFAEWQIFVGYLKFRTFDALLYLIAKQIHHGVTQANCAKEEKKNMSKQSFEPSQLRAYALSKLIASIN